ncbi:hypothetical protein SDC9_156746 [bioreactor metagenome]|uniref:Uncharacterized protein n=1 Tax=bioreactor metagenome TaxID=1076179 RepID=A0A645F723_9ZZZZ
MDAGLLVGRGPGRVGLGAGRLEDEVGLVVLGEQPLGALGGGLQADALGALQAVRLGIDTDHVRRLDVLALAEQLEHQVGTDVAGTHNRCGVLLRHEMVLRVRGQAPSSVLLTPASGRRTRRRPYVDVRSRVASEVGLGCCPCGR